MTRSRAAFAAIASALLLAGAGVALSPPASAASLVEVTSFGNNPGNMRMHIYVPDSRPANPAIVVAMHGCGGSGPGFYSGSEFASLADRNGFIVIYPTATQNAGFGNCFDTWSEAAKRRDGGSDPVSIASMVAYAGRQYGGDQNRVYATGSSSGGMMTQHLLAVYPDLFKAGASFMGVPFNCFANAADYPPGSSQCTGGRIDRTPQQWGDAVRQAYPGYTGPRPPIQLWHGTNDTLVPYQLLQESIEQWTNVHGLSTTPTATDNPQPNWNRRRFGDRVEAYSIQGAGHSLPASGMAAAAIAFFGLTTGTPTTTLAASAGCGQAPTLTNGTHTIQSGGTQRSFILRLPGNYDNNRPYRLIFGFHWLGGNADNVASGDYYGLGALSGNSAIFVAPQGLDNGWANTGGRDVTFTDDMVNRITSDLCVDTTQLFSLGFSYGGGMSYALACARADVFRAVAIYSGGVISGCSGGTQPIGYLQAHGLSDNVLSISGARPMRDRFVANNGCTAASPPEPAPGSGTHTSFAYSGCRAGYPVEWHVFDGGHTATPRDAGSNTAWLPDVTWRFFTQF